jgi:hypothetical protein
VQTRFTRIIGPSIVGVGLIGATLYIGAVDPNTPGHYPMCPLKAITGLDCPGCGGLRAVHSLVHGDLAGALNHNLLAVLLFIPAIAIWWALWFRREWLEASPSGTSPHSGDTQAGGAVVAAAPWLNPSLTRRLWLSAFVVIGIFTVIRNIPGVPVFEWLNSAA